MPIKQPLLSYSFISFLIRFANSFSSNSADSYDICSPNFLLYKSWNFETIDFEYLNIGISSLTHQKQSAINLNIKVCLYAKRIIYSLKENL